MGTVVFPEADVKFFLDARPEVRGRRRYRELLAKGEKRLTLREVYEQLVTRDRNDQGRELAPLKPAADAIVIDSTELEVDQVVALMVRSIDERSVGRA
jgi:cytidylate kinase